MSRDSTTVASRWPKVVAGDGSVRSSAGTYTAWIEVIEPFLVEVMRSCRRAHLLGERRLVAHRGRHAAQQRRHFGAGEREAVDVVDEEQDVAALVAEALGHGEAGERHAQAVARRLVHLAEHHRDLRLGQVLLHDDLGFRSSRDRSRCPRACARPRRRTPTGPSAAVAMLLMSSSMFTVLPTPAPPNRPILPPLANGQIEVDHLDAGLEQLHRGRELVELGRGAVDRAALLSVLTGPRSSIGRPSTSITRPERGRCPPAPRSARRCSSPSCRGAGRRRSPSRWCARRRRPAAARPRT